MKNIKTMFAAIVIPVALIVAFMIFSFVLGNPANFIENNPAGEPIKEGVGSYLGVIYKGGIIVPVLIAMFLIVITFTVERMLTIRAAKGKGSVDSFISRIRALVTNHDFSAAEQECDRQKGSIANVVKAGLNMYKQMEQDKELDKERKILAIQKELEEATTLELPMLSKNLVIISTIASIATLMGLLGTVIGMIRAFKALAQAGAPDAIALSTGISEALINTALGILTSAIAIIFYNYFTNKIDALTYGIDEAGYTIVQNFAAKNK
ncbi:MAG TPA: MotA/TolQ/ExbB proton channel family protein [Chitinophagaceae bacterium]|nr:MotA/TolQ/ExbB proton channel family protein [Chitinophagaceae bacterium]